MSNARSRLSAYGRTPKALLRDSGIRPVAKIIYTMIDEVAGYEDITMERLGEWLGVNIKTARKALHEIVEAGWVEVVTVVEGQRGQLPSEYVANAYPFQHLSEGSEEVSRPQVSDQAQRPGPLPLSSDAVEKSGTPPYQKVPSKAPAQTGVPKSGTPRGSQKVVPPSSLRDDETVTTPRPASTDGFREFWIAYPETGYKGRKDDCRKIWLALPMDERRRAYTSLMAWKNSVLWQDRERIPTPFQWLDGETWLGDRPEQVKVRKMYSADEVALSD